MQFIKKNKNEILKLIIFIITTILVFFVIKDKFKDVILWPYEVNSRILIIMFSFVFFEYSIYYEMRKSDMFWELFYKLIPAIFISCVLLYVEDDKFKYIPFLLPLIMILMSYRMLNALLFQSFIVLTYYFTEFMTIEALVFYVFFFTLVFFLAKHSDSKNKFILSGILSIISYVIVSLDYQYMSYEKIDVIVVLIGLIPLLISILPLYFKYILISLNSVYLSNSLKKICDDENEILLSLMNKDENAYFHSLRVADVSVRVAKTVGADVQLVNAGARFHEIGKLKSQNYVSAGIEIMHKNKFPREVIKIIKEHNSKTHKPKTIESAIVMLSDSIETTINSIIETKGDSFNKRKIVENIIDIRFDTGMLDDSIKEIDEFKKIRKAYISIYSWKQVCDGTWR